MNKLLLWTAALALATAITADARTRTPFNDGWLFAKGEAKGAETVAFDDSEWREVRLPHDWAIEGPAEIDSAILTTSPRQCTHSRTFVVIRAHSC